MLERRERREWTIEREARLTELWASGLSCSQIAAQLGGFDHCDDGGRCAVLGKIHRMRLPPPGTRKPKSSANHRPRAARIRVPKTAGTESIPAERVRRKSGPKAAWVYKSPPLTKDQRIARAEEEAAAAREAMAVVEPIDPATAVTLEQLEDTHCKWPLGDPSMPEFRYCGGKPVPDQPYCFHHCEVAFNGTPPPLKLSSLLHLRKI